MCDLKKYVVSVNDVMFANLGYVGSAAQNPGFRDAVFIGSSGHPSKKVHTMAPRRVAVAPPVERERVRVSVVSEEGTVLQRCEFLERQAKSHTGNTTDLVARVDRLDETSELSAQCVVATLEVEAASVVVRADESAEEALLRCQQPSEFEWVAARTNVVLAYPMRELHGQEVWMKNKVIDEVTGQLGWRWLQIATRAKGRLVSHFRFFA